MENAKRERSDRIIVTVDAELESLIPGYLDNRRRDVAVLRQAVSEGDMERVRVIGHTMKGTGSGYGFDAITDIGYALETAAKQSATANIVSETRSLEDYLARVEVVFQES